MPVIYATRDDMFERYGRDELQLAAARDGGSRIDRTTLDTALSDASAEIDACISARYALPLPSVPPFFVRLCCLIAYYRISDDAGTVTEEKRQRYEDAIEYLKRAVEGTAGLGLDNAPPESGGGATVVAEERIFTRTTQRGIL